ncbi:MAG: hypothetical protein WC560_10720 [Syntrophales bacterium]
MKEFIISLFFPVFVVVLAFDLLYLYFDNRWYDPTKWLEVTEICLLVIFVIIGTIRILQLFKRGY